MQTRLFNREGDRAAALDLTPMVDVTFLLLIFFMVTASFTIQKTLSFPPPVENRKQYSGVPQRKEDFQDDSVLVDVDEIGAIVVDGIAVADPTQLVTAIEQARAAEGRLKDRVLITRHYDCPHDVSVRVVDAARQAQLQKILIATEPGSRPEY